jgi:2-(1,2-epoxy-1,2-dihydrophenyl)acetyl-CoA isomerase
MDKLVIAAVNGAAAGIGMALALACDLLVMSDTGYFLSPFTTLGLIPDGGAAWHLVRHLGHQRALEMLIEGQKLTATRCLELGIANRVVGPAELKANAIAWAAALAEKAPIAVSLTKRVVRLSTSVGLSDLLTLEAELQSFCAATEDSREAIAAFGAKRRPIFRGC